MTIDRRVSSIESSFKMESRPFDAECRQRVRDVLVKKVSAADAITELNKKYRVSKTGQSVLNTAGQMLTTVTPVADKDLILFHNPPPLEIVYHILQDLSTSFALFFLHSCAKNAKDQAKE